MMEEADRIRYETLFYVYCQKLENGFLSGDGARALFIRSKLPLPDLTRIWKLSDVTHDNKLDVFEFSIAMHLIELRLCGQDTPKQLDLSSFHKAEKDVIIPVMTTTEKRQLEEIFEHKDTNSQGFLERDVVKPMLLASGLAPLILSRIWSIADLDRDGKLTLLEFTIAFHLVKHCLQGIGLNGPVNPFLIVPEEENAIRSCTEKLKIFDKELLLKQKKREKEDCFVSSGCELSDFDFELLAKYLPSNADAPNKGESDDVDEKYNSFDEEHVDSTRVLHQHTGFDDLVCASKEKGKHCTDSDKVERSLRGGNELAIDLDSVFEMVEKEHGKDYEEGPKYIARPAAVDRAEEEQDVTTDALPFLKRRTYVGKDLIFEDPIGSETIGDVEFEVDFDTIVKDIEKESYNRLPIARVLPIYKSLPSANEQPFKKTTTAQDKHEIDLDFTADHSVKTGKQESSGIDREKREINANSIYIDPFANGSRQELDSGQENGSTVLHRGVEDSKRDMLPNDSTKIENAKNWDKRRDEDAVIDIVEQKRMIVQSRLEERKKLRDKILNDYEPINSTKHFQPRSVPDKPFAKEAFVKKKEEKGGDISEYQERRPKTDGNIYIHTTNTRLVKNETRITEDNRKPSPERGDERKNWTGQNTISIERNVIVANRLQTNKVNHELKTTSKEVNKAESIVDEENEEEEETAKKERQLVDRIQFLERKRQQLSEQKQREQDRQSTSEHEIQKTRTVFEAKETAKVTPNSINMKSLQDERNYQETKNNNKTRSVDIWSDDFAEPRKVNYDSMNSEEEKKRLTLALEAKRKSEAELEKRRESELREAEKRRLEQMAKDEEENLAAKERKRNFLENLEKLKQRVVTEEAENSGQTKRDPGSSVPAGIVSRGTSGKLNSNFSIFARQPEVTPGRSKTEDVLEQRVTSSSGIDVYKNITAANQVNDKQKLEQTNLKKSQSVVHNSLSARKNEMEAAKEQRDDVFEKEEQLKEDEIRRENFKSNRELFMKKVEREKEMSGVLGRVKSKTKTARPKSFYGGMFNKPLHQIIDDSVLTHSTTVDLESAPDLVDEEALEQFRREEELKKERERVSKLRHSLERDTSYTVENVEQFWEVDQDSESKIDQVSNSSEKKREKSSSNPKRRSLVNTLTTDWNSFLDILEDDQRRESETVKMRQDISAQRKSKEKSKEREAKNVAINCSHSKDVKSDASEENVSGHVNEQCVESDVELLAKQSGKVKELVKSYKRLSAPCLLQQDVLWDPCLPSEKADQDTQMENYNLHKMKRSEDETNYSHARNQLERQQPLNSDIKEIKTQQQKRIIKDNAPRRKSDLAHAWSNMVSNQ